MRGVVKYFYLILSLLILVGCAMEQPVAETIPATVAAPAVAESTTVEPMAESADTPTDIATMAPWTPEGLAVGYAVHDQVSGSCWMGALTSARPDAWRCGARQGATGTILDPCLANPYDADSPLACLRAGGGVTLLTLTEPLPEKFANPTESESLPLTLFLDNGDECDLATGATTTVDLGQGPERVNFFCTSGAAIIGVPDRSGAIWTVKYASDPGNLEDYQTLGIARASVFRGDTGTVGWNSPSETAGALTDVSVEEQPGAHRVTFDFGGVTMPDYEIGYTNEPIVDENGNELALEGEYHLRLWFRYPQTETPAVGAQVRVEPARQAYFNESVLARAVDGNIILYLGLNEQAGFEATRSEDDTVLYLDIFEPDVSLSDLPVLGVGSQGDAIRVLQERLVALGYLDALSAEPKFDEPTRLAVVALQRDRGLIPDGVVGPAVWAALARPVPPRRQGTSQRDMPAVARLTTTQQGDAKVTPAEAYPVNVHSGPGLDYETVAMLNPGEAAPVLSQIDTGDPITSWWEIICCQGMAGWVRADVVNVVGSYPAVTQAHHPGRSPNASQGIRPDNRPLENAVGQPILYFTFDDGPYSPDTELVMDVLGKNEAEATFFVIGQQVVWDPELTQQETLREHSVQNHTYSHSALDDLEREAFYQEVEETQVAIQKATDILPTCLRPPYGATDERTIQEAGELGLDIVLWTIDTQDWTRPGTEALVEYILDNVYPGAILLMHDGGGDRSQTIAALEQVLPQLSAQGYVFERLCR